MFDSRVIVLALQTPVASRADRFLINLAKHRPPAEQNQRVKDCRYCICHCFLGQKSQDSSDSRVKDSVGGILGQDSLEPRVKYSVDIVYTIVFFRIKGKYSVNIVYTIVFLDKTLQKQG